MSDKMRWRYGDTNPVIAAVDSTTVIEIGDVVWQDTDDAKPASMLANHGTKAANQAALGAALLGVAMQRSRSGETAPIRVATTGVFELDCAGGTFELGDTVGAAANTGGAGLVNQQVEKVTVAAGAIGRVAKRLNPAGVHVLVDIRSTVMTGGVVGTTHSGT
jgi:hypothetical protein